MLPAPSQSSMASGSDDDADRVVSRRILEPWVDLSGGVERTLPAAAAVHTPAAAFCTPRTAPTHYVFMHGHGGAGEVEAVPYDVLMHQFVDTPASGAGIAPPELHIDQAGGGEGGEEDMDVTQIFVLFPGLTWTEDVWFTSGHEDLLVFNCLKTSWAAKCVQDEREEEGADGSPEAAVAATLGRGGDGDGEGEDKAGRGGGGGAGSGFGRWEGVAKGSSAAGHVCLLRSQIWHGIHQFTLILWV